MDVIFTISTSAVVPVFLLPLSLTIRPISLPLEQKVSVVGLHNSQHCATYFHLLSMVSRLYLRYWPFNATPESCRPKRVK